MPFAVRRLWRIASTISAYFSTVTARPLKIIQKIAPGPPSHRAVATPAIFPTPSVPASAMHIPPSGETPVPNRRGASAARRRRSGRTARIPCRRTAKYPLTARINKDVTAMTESMPASPLPKGLYAPRAPDRRVALRQMLTICEYWEKALDISRNWCRICVVSWHS